MVKYINISNCDVAITLGVSEYLVHQITQKCKEFYEYQVLDCPVENQWLITSEPILDKTKQKTHTIIQQYEILDEPMRKFLVDEKRRILQIVEPVDEKWLSQILIRITRDALRNLAHHKMHFLHGAFVVYKNKGICILGEKRGGKTTTVLNILSSNHTSFISNDDVSIEYCSTRNEWIAYGWPRSLSVRKDSFSALKKIGIDFNMNVKLSHPYNQNNVSNECLTFYPADFSLLTNSPIEKKHRLDIVLFTSFSTENKFASIDSRLGEKRLARFIEYDINKYFGELGTFFSSQGICKTPIIGDGIRYFDIQQDFSNLKNITQLLDDTNLF